MSLPQLLLVDDSEAVLAFGRAALSGHYQISTAKSGVEALAKMDAQCPAAVLLDLSMPEMDGDVVLAQMRRDPRLSQVPVVILSSEKGRAEACIAAGAAAFVAKPARAAELLAAIGRALDDVRRSANIGSLRLIPIEAGTFTLALPLDAVITVLAQPATQPLARGPAFLCEQLEVWGAPVPVLDLPLRLCVEHLRRVEERQLLIVRIGARRLAICVDAVHDPEELAPALLSQPDVATSSDQPDQLAGNELLRCATRTLASSSRGRLAVVDPAALLPSGLLEELAP